MIHFLKRLFFFCAALIALAIPMRALAVGETGDASEGTNGIFLPRDLTAAVPETAEDFFRDGDFFWKDAEYSPRAFSDGVGRIAESVGKAAKPVFRQSIKGAAAILLAVLLCGAVRGLCRGETELLALSLTGALAVTALSAGSLEQMIGLGWETIGDLNSFSKALLPTLAAATAASGSITMATFQQVTTVFLAEALIGLMDGLLMPLIYLYVGVLTASCALGEERLALLAAGVKRIATSILTGTLLLFTVYLSVFRIVAGSADAAAVRTARAAISHVVPVVGGILAEASEAILAGSGLLRNSIGIFGMLAILAACAYPFLQLGIQYLLYKGAALLASAVGSPELCRLIDGLGGAFGLVLGMAASCALLLLIAILSFLSAAV